MKQAFVPLVLALAALAPAAQAQMFKDPALEALYEAEKTDELHRVSQQRLSAKADDAQAVLGLAMAALLRDDAAARKAAIERAEACVAVRPDAVPCQYALGVVLGIQAMNEGMMAAMRSIGPVRDALRAAHQGDPQWYPARSALMEMNLELPYMMGGSKSQAETLARGAPRPEEAAVLALRLQLADEKAAGAVLAAYQALPAGLEHSLAEDARGWALQAAMMLARQGKAAQAQPFFERLARERPNHAAGFYGQALVKAEGADWAASLRLLEAAAKLKGHDAFPLPYRMGIAQQALGQNDAARASFTRYLKNERGRVDQRDDARKRLDQLGG